ncbi:hypothetical protein MPL3356_340198 [Mesorhizobium plurifarium]|uniref:Uncharacterized protein n=1 Tax=Mesorhizobium plurifarium TaxID=69974 RepID=A0A090E214_MESPL|nr:hypothetical protein MPL3356_340198 [Mesorhizobium plurifarium]
MGEPYDRTEPAQEHAIGQVPRSAFAIPFEGEPGANNAITDVQGVWLARRRSSPADGRLLSKQVRGPIEAAAAFTATSGLIHGVKALAADRLVDSFTAHPRGISWFDRQRRRWRNAMHVLDG